MHTPKLRLYARQLWDPFTSKGKQSLEVVQKLHAKCASRCGIWTTSPCYNFLNLLHGLSLINLPDATKSSPRISTFKSSLLCQSHVSY